MVCDVGILTSSLRGGVKIPDSRMTKTWWETVVTCLGNVCDKSQRPFVQPVEGIRLLCTVKAEGPVSFVKCLQRSPTE